MIESANEIIQREFASYRVTFVQWDKISKIVYRITDVGEQYIGGYDPYFTPCWNYWSAIQFDDDDSELGNFEVVSGDGRIYGSLGYKPFAGSAYPLEWVIARSERQLKEHWQSLQQVAE